jgi:L-ascorbate metabolism protein UlaG (beta-lactamase superfamily)
VDATDEPPRHGIGTQRPQNTPSTEEDRRRTSPATTTQSEADGRTRTGDPFSTSENLATGSDDMRLTLVRNATLILELAGVRLLVDPMVAPVGALPAVDPATDDRRNPLVGMPMDASELVEQLDAALVTHLHRDHFDADAAERLPPDTLIATQPDSAPILRWMGFQRVTEEPILEIGGLRLTRTAGRHTLDGRLANTLGPVCGFAVEARGEPRVLIAGDSVWCDELAAALRDRRPDVIVVNAGAARIGGSLPISMDAADVIRTARAAPRGTLVAVHLEALSHCPMRRAELIAELRAADLEARVSVPEDGGVLDFNS